MIQLETFSLLTFLIGLAVVGLGVWLIKAKGHALTAGGLAIANVGLYILLSGFLTMNEADRQAIVLTTVFISAIVMIFLPITVVRIIGIVIAILSFIALQSTMVSLPDDSNVKIVLMEIGGAAKRVWSFIWPWD